MRLMSLFLLLNLCAFSAEKISFTILVGSGKHREVNRELIRLFESENPDIQVELLETSNTRYHNFIEQKKFLKHDVIWWFAGFQLKDMARAGYMEPLTEWWKENNLNEQFEIDNDSIMENGEIYALPLSYYHWGIYYNKEIFEKYELEEPETWEEFLEVCEVLRKVGIKPFASGIKDHWTASAWFSYLNLRINGLKFHLDLLAGKESFKDKRITEVLEKWKVVLDRDYFINTMDEYEWNTAIPYLYRGKAAMMLIGNFIFVQTPEKFNANFGFFKFPTLKDNFPIYEERPTDVLFISKYSKNKEAAKRFLLFMSRADVQQIFNDPQGYISPNRFSGASKALMIQEGKEAMDGADGFSQFFDRDTTKSMAEECFKIFGQFMRDPDIEKTQSDLEKARVEFLM